MRPKEDPCRCPASEARDDWADLEGPGPTDEERRANARALSKLTVHERFALMFRGPKPDTPMNLYRIIVLHGAPKDSHTSVETYLVAPDEESVAEWINQNKVYGHWFPDDDDEENMRCGDGPEYKEIPFREWVMKHKGDLDDEEGWGDAYYGVTKWGWEQVEGASLADIETLVRLGIAVPFAPILLDTNPES